MQKKLEVAVIGLGKFGLTFGETLTNLGHKVIGLDLDPMRIQEAQDKLSLVYEANAINKDVLMQLELQDLDVVTVSVGNSMEASILVSLNLIEMGFDNIIVKAISPTHAKILQKLGIRRVIQPEAEVAALTARRIHYPGMLDFLPIGKGVLIQEVEVAHWAGKSLVDLNLRNNHGVLAAAIQPKGEANFQFVPDPQIPLNEGDKLLLIGNQGDVLALKP